MKRFTYSLLFVGAIHICGLIGLSFLRLILFISGHHLIGGTASGSWLMQSTAFVRGAWFDNVIACYISLLPLVAIMVIALCNYQGKRLWNVLTLFSQILWGITLAISVANIPYFLYFLKDINSSIFNWMEYGTTTLGMMFEEPSYYLPIGILIVFLILFVWITNRIKKVFLKKMASVPTADTKVWQNRLAVLGCGLCICGLCVFGIRGRTGYNPIKVSAAYYCTDPFLNQLGVNPTFNLLTSTLDELRPENKQLHLMNDNLAIHNVRKLLGCKGDNAISPLYRDLKFDTTVSRKPNVVIIFMESMSANLMKTFGQEKELTPFLDSLFHQSLGFTHYYSAGIHTNHGLYASLYSFPAIMKRNLMKGSDIPRYTGLPDVLKKNGYRNLFFMTHESQYDNMNAFFRTNGFDEIYSQENYPADKVVNSFGVQDDFLYEYALSVLNRKSQDNKPFMACLLSISNHPPYIIPSWFHAKSKIEEEQIVEYADWSIRQFFEKAKKEPWFRNTIFVLQGDHGKLVGKADCEMPTSYNHIPFIIYSPNLKPQTISNWGGQVDIQPTLLHLLGINAPQINFGVDLLSQKRPCMFYTADNRIGARNENRLFIFEPSTGQTFLYYITKDGKEFIPTKKTDKQFIFLKNYVFSMLQTAEVLVKERKTVIKGK